MSPDGHPGSKPTNIEDIMDKTIIINGVEIRAYVDGLGIRLKLVKGGEVKLDSYVDSINLARIIRPETLPAVEALIAEVTDGSKDEIAAAIKAARAELAAERAAEAECGWKRVYDAKTPFGRTVRDDATTRAMAI